MQVGTQFKTRDANLKAKKLDLDFVVTDTKKITCINIYFLHHSSIPGDSPSKVQQSQQGCLFFDFAPPCAFYFDQKLTQNVAQIILYYHVTRQFFLACFD